MLNKLQDLNIVFFFTDVSMETKFCLFLFDTLSSEFRLFMQETMFVYASCKFFHHVRRKFAINLLCSSIDTFTA